LHKHHLIIRVGAGLIQFVYGSHSRLAADLTLDKNLFSLPFSFFTFPSFSRRFLHIYISIHSYVKIWIFSFIYIYTYIHIYIDVSLSIYIYIYTYIYRFLKDLRWCIRHHSSLEKSAKLYKFGLSAGPQLHSGRKPVKLKSIWIWANGPQRKVLNYCFQ